MKKFLFAFLLLGFFIVPSFLKQKDKKIVVKKKLPQAKKITQTVESPKPVPLYTPDTPFKKTQPLYFNHLKKKLREINQPKKKSPAHPVEKTRPLRLNQEDHHISFLSGA